MAKGPLSDVFLVAVALMISGCVALPAPSVGSVGESPPSPASTPAPATPLVSSTTPLSPATSLAPSATPVRPAATAAAPASPAPPAAAGLAGLHLGWIWPQSHLQPLSGRAAVADKDGSLYVIDTKATLYALSPNGQELWKYHGNYDLAVGPWLSRDTQVLYIVTDRGDVVSLGTDGTERWSRMLPDGAQQMWVAPDGTLLFVTADGGTRVTPDGQQEGPFTWADPKYVSASFDGSGRLFAPALSEIWVYSAQGEKERACEAKIFGFSQIIVGLPDEGFVYGDLEGDLVAVNPECQELWRYTASSTPETGWGWRSVAPAPDGAVFASRANGELHALDAAGKLRWLKTLDQDLGQYLLAGPDGSVFAVGSAGDLAAFDSSGEQVWSRSPYYGGAPSEPVLSADDGIAIVHGGRLHFYALDPAVTAPEPTAVLPPVDARAAEAEIVTMLLDLAGCQGEAIAVWNSGPNDSGAEDAKGPLKVWWCQASGWVEQADMQAAIAKADKLIEEADPDARQYPVARFSFSIDFIADDRQEARVQMDSMIGPLWGSGYEYTLRRTPSGQWSIVDSKMLWVS